MRIRANAPNSIHDNGYLSFLESCGNETINHFRQKNVVPSKSQFKTFYSSLVNDQPILGKSNVVLEYFETFINLKEGTVSASTIDQYKTTKNHLAGFIKKKRNGITIEFSDLDTFFIKDFISYLRKEELMDNTIHKNIKKFRSVMNHATLKGVNTKLDYKESVCQVSYVQQPKIYLNDKELAKLKKYKIESKSRLDKVRDILFLGCNTGLRYSDLSRLSMDMVTTSNGKDIIKIRVEKKGDFVSIPINKQVKKILKKYNGIPPMISNQRFNEYLQELCKAAKINTPVYRDEDKQQVKYEKHELVSSHICRRSFATNFYKMNVPPELLRKVTGHSTIKQFMEYICIEQEEAVDMLADYPAFK